MCLWETAISNQVSCLIPDCFFTMFLIYTAYEVYFYIEKADKGKLEN